MHRFAELLRSRVGARPGVRIPERHARPGAHIELHAVQHVSTGEAAVHKHLATAEQSRRAIAALRGDLAGETSGARP